MRHIYLEDDLRLRFPGGDETFDDGFEIGMLAALMGQKQPSITRVVSARTLSYLRPLSERLGYRILAEQTGDGMMQVTLLGASARPRLRVVSGS